MATCTSSSMQAFTLREKGEWATIALRGWEHPVQEGVSSNVSKAYGGELLVHSSFGSWAHAWNSCGSPFPEFLLELDFDYLMGKLMGLELMQFDPQASVQGLLRHICQRRRDRAWSREEARDVFNELQACEMELRANAQEFVHACQEISSYLQGRMPAIEDELDAIFGDPHAYIEQRKNPAAVEFWRLLWKPFCDELGQQVGSNERTPLSPSAA